MSMMIIKVSGEWPNAALSSKRELVFDATYITSRDLAL